MYQVQGFKPHPLLRDCVDCYLVAEVPPTEKYCVENTILPHVYQSLALDLVIVFETVKVILSGKGGR